MNSEDFGNEALPFENGKSLGLLAGSDEARDDAELLVNIEGDAAFAGAVELGEDEAVEGGGFVKFLGLVQGIGAGGGIHDEECEVGRAGILFGDGAADFPELLHEVVACVDAAGGVADEETGFFLDGSLVGVEADGGGVGFWFSGDDGDVEAVAPALELLDGGGAESVCGGE